MKCGDYMADEIISAFGRNVLVSAPPGFRAEWWRSAGTGIYPGMVVMRTANPPDAKESEEGNTALIGIALNKPGEDVDAAFANDVDFPVAPIGSHARCRVFFEGIAGPVTQDEGDAIGASQVAAKDGLCGKPNVDGSESSFVIGTKKGKTVGHATEIRVGEILLDQ